MAQFLRPSSDITTTEIVGSYLDIDEISANDSDFISSNDSSDAVYETLLSSATDPLVSTGHTIRVRHAKADTNIPPSTNGNGQTASFFLYQGGTLIATLGSVITLGNWTTLTYTLTTAEANNITDYSNLRVRMDAPSGGGGNPNNRRGAAVSWIEMEIPSLVLNYDLLANKGSYSVTEKNADLVKSSVEISEKGIFSLLGKNADLTYQTVGAYDLLANKRSFAFSGKFTYLAYPSLIERLIVLNGNVVSFNGKITSRYEV